MVLEALINPFKAEKKPWETYLLGLVYSSIAVLLSLWVFRDYASLVMVFLTVLACVPLFYSTVRYEEQKDLSIPKETTLIKEHSKAIVFLMFLFAGITTALVLWYVFLPSHVTEILFSVQTNTINDVNTKALAPNAVSNTLIFTKIFFNNVKVLVFCILFAFIYGAGAIFILTWNASVIAAAMGNFVRTHLAVTSNYFQVASLALLRYSIHGIPEIAAYFIAGLAGGIISSAVINHDFGSDKFERILLDSSDLIIIAIAFLFFGAILETYVITILF